MANNESDKILEKHREISVLTYNLSKGEICVRSFIKQLYAINIRYASDVKDELEKSEEKLLEECDRIIGFVAKEINNSMDDEDDEEIESIQHTKHDMEAFFNKIKAEAYDDIHELRQITQSEVQNRQAPKLTKPNTGRYVLASGLVVFLLAVLFFLYDKFAA